MKKNLLNLAASGAIALAGCITAPSLVRAADHADGPTASNNQGLDLADVFAFLDPTDNSKAVLILTWRGFIIPGENVNLTVFDPDVRFRYEIENTGDENPDRHLNITFGPKLADANNVILPQKFFFSISDKKNDDGKDDDKRFECLGTVPSVGPNPTPPPINTFKLPTGETIDLFAGLVDDPFFFDIPGFSKFAASARAHTADPSKPLDTAALNRGRDTFAGYNLLSVALRLPASLLRAKNSTRTQVGVALLAQLPRVLTANATGDPVGEGPFVTVDREAIPGVNAVLLPLNLRDGYNASHPSKDPKPNSIYAAAIVKTLTALGTDAAHIGALAELAVNHGDYLRLETNPSKSPNLGTGGGNNAGSGFPNGRRLHDDVIDVLINVVTNGAITTGDHVDGNDVPFLDKFPFLAPSQQPLPSGTIDDRTRN